MKTTVTKLEDCKVKLSVEVDPEAWKDAKAKAKTKLLSKVSLKGFRKGHVPAAMAEKYVRLEEIVNEALNGLVNPVFNEALRQENLSPYDKADVNVLKLEDDGVTLEFSFTHGPHVELGPIEGHSLKKDVASVSEKEIEDDISRRLEEAADLVTVEREAKEGDTVIIDFVGYLDGKEFEGGSAENYELVLGSHSFVPGFEEGVVGMKAEEQKDIDLTFPEQYVAELAGKEVTFRVTLHEVKEKVVHPLTDESVLDLNIRDVKTVDELKEFVKKDLLQRKVNAIEGDYINKVIAEIVKASKVTYPSAILEDETKGLVEKTRKQVEDNGLTFQQYLEITGATEESFTEAQRQSAKAELDTYFVLDAIAFANKLNATVDEVNAEVAKICERYGLNKEQVKNAYGGSFDRLARDIRQNKLVRFLLEKNPAINEEKPVEEGEKAEKAEKPEKAEKKEEGEKPAPKKKAAPKAKAEAKPEGEEAPKKAPAKKPAAKKAPAKKDEGEGEGK